MNNKLLVLILMLFSATTFASVLHIIVKNDTHDSCELINAYAVKGSGPFSVIKTTLLSSEKTKIKVTDSIFYHLDSWDIDYVLSYRCGNAQVGYKKITFSSKLPEHSCYARPYGEILSDLTDQGITANIEDTSTSIIFDGISTKAGEIVWSIRM